jgi:menaquinone-dependent protoporphyrinogen oxidase
MSRILVLYGTSDGHTGKIATAIGNALNAGGYDADVIEAGTVDPSIGLYDGVIVAGSVRVGRFQRPLVECVRAHAAAIAAKPNAFVPVCLAVLRKTDPRAAAELKKNLDRFSTDTGWTPAAVKWVAGALPYSRYNFVVRLMMKWIVGKAGGDTDTSRDYVYTDWEDVRGFAEDFGRRLKAAAA